MIDARIIGSGAAYIQGCRLPVRDLDVLVGSEAGSAASLRRLCNALGIESLDLGPLFSENRFLRDPDLGMPVRDDPLDWSLTKIADVPVRIARPHILLCHRLKTISDLSFLIEERCGDRPIERLAHKMRLLSAEAAFYWETVVPEHLTKFARELPDSERSVALLLGAARFAREVAADDPALVALLDQIVPLLTLATNDKTDSGILTTERLKPRTIRQCHVQLVSDCPLRCSHCPYKWTGTSLPLNKLSERALEWVEAGLTEVNLGAACEPLLYGHLGEAVDLLNSLGLNVNISTSLAVDISSERLKALASRCSNVAMSVDGFHFRSAPKSVPPAIHERVEAVVSSGAYTTLSLVYEIPFQIDLSAVTDFVRALGLHRVAFIRKVDDSFGEIWRDSDLPTFAALHQALAELQAMSIDVIFRNSDPILYCLDPARFPLELQAIEKDGSFSVFLDADGAYRRTQSSPAESAIHRPLAEARLFLYD